ncbi:TPA: LOW QUALITY PROTEIN: hypothetical protein N0F65_009044 [Lagenidium giganteum]|uniref:EF-hand domain-containing protein n=1 Tax=Lagenidium giganteum TaxID=4803 RepID=A0AAV2YWH4_9STRA|nr:TPA: LOW QUALITY PROTEIN: hypothetical protein N0F65_009044 [Lagenidium giganteum]
MPADAPRTKRCAPCQLRKGANPHIQLRKANTAEMGGSSLFHIGDNVEMWRVIQQLTIVVLFVIFFEHCLHKLEHTLKKYPKYHEMMTKIFGELMILGFIGLGIKVVKEVSHLDPDSPTMMAFQVADLTVFIVAMALIVQSVCVFLLIRQKNMQVDQAELISSADLYDLVSKHKEDNAGKNRFLVGCCSTPKKLISKGPVGKEINPAHFHEIVQMRILRHFFLRTYGLPELFPFSKYLRQAQDNQITHMIEVQPSTWIMLIGIAWLLEIISVMLRHFANEQKQFAILLAFTLFSWVSVLLNICVTYYFAWAIQSLVAQVSSHSNEDQRLECLKVVALNETETANHEMAVDAILTMEHVREKERQKRFKRHRHHLVEHDVGFQLIGTIWRKIGACRKRGNCDVMLDELEAMDRKSSEGAPKLHIKWFSRKAWHFIVMSTLMLNGFYMALFCQSVLYQLRKIEHDFGVIFVVLVMMPMIINMVVFQPIMLRNFILISSVLRVDDTALGEVIDHFTETVQLRSEFVHSVTDFMVKNSRTMAELWAEFEARDVDRTGLIEVDDLRLILQNYGVKLSFFRFNSVAKLLFQLRGTKLEYAQVKRLLALGQADDVRIFQNESLFINEHDIEFHLGGSILSSKPSSVSGGSVYLHATAGAERGSASSSRVELAAHQAEVLLPSTPEQNLHLQPKATGGGARQDQAPKTFQRASSSAARSLYHVDYASDSNSTRTSEDVTDARSQRMTTSYASLFHIGGNVDLWRVISYLTVLVIFVMTFEAYLHRLQHNLRRHQKYHEMMAKVAHDSRLHRPRYQNLKELTHLDPYSPAMIAFQAADLTMFILAISLILQATCVFLVLRRKNIQVDQAELISSADLYRIVSKYQAENAYGSRWFARMLPVRHQPPPTTRDINPSDFNEFIQIRILRHSFLRGYGLPQLFPFSKYIREAQDNQITHMIEVQASTWIMLLSVAWLLQGFASLLHEVAHDKRPFAILVAFTLFSWSSVLLNIGVAFYFRSAIQKLVAHVSKHDDERQLLECLNAVAEEETATVNREMALEAITAMEHAREAERATFESQNEHDGLLDHDEGFQLIRPWLQKLGFCRPKSDDEGIDAMKMSHLEAAHPRKSSADPEDMHLKWFSRKAWHFAIMLMLMLNGFFMALFFQCVLYQLRTIDHEYGIVFMLIIPLPMIVNILFFQPLILRDFILISSVLRLDCAALSNVIDNFNETVQLRTEFVSIVTENLERQKLAVSDLMAQCKIRDRQRTGMLSVNELRLVLHKFGFKLSYFRFNSVAKLLFQLKGTKVEYEQVERLLQLGQQAGFRQFQDECFIFFEDGIGFMASSSTARHSVGNADIRGDVSTTNGAPTSPSQRGVQRASAIVARSLFQLELPGPDPGTARQSTVVEEPPSPSIMASLFKVGDSVELWRMLLNFTVLALCLVVLEKALHALEHSAERSPKYHEMINKAYRELMILGLIGLGIKIFKETGLVDESSPEMVAFLCADLTIFIMAVVLILQAICIFLQLRRKNKEIDTLELFSADDLYTLATHHEQLRLQDGNPITRWWSRGKYDELMEMRILRHLFLRMHGLPELFPFAKYLRQAQDNQITHMIDVEVSMWFIIFLVCWLWYALAQSFSKSDVIESIAKSVDDAARMAAIAALSNTTNITATGSGSGSDSDSDSSDGMEDGRRLMISSKHATKDESMHYAVASVFLIFSWMLVLFHLASTHYLEWCMHAVLKHDGLTTKSLMLTRLHEIANEEAEILAQEVTSVAIKRMERVQEEQQVKQHKRRHRLTEHDTGFQLVATVYRKISGRCGGRNAENGQGRSRAGAVDTGEHTPETRLKIPGFSRKGWHFTIKLLLILNALYAALFVQTMMYLLPQFVADFGLFPTLIVPLPLVFNACFVQMPMLRHFVLVSSICRVDVDTLASLIDHFTETVQLQGSFISSVHASLLESGKSIQDLEDLFAARDTHNSGWIDVEDMRQVLHSVGFQMSFFRFNSVMRLLFQLRRCKVDYHKVITLLTLADDHTTSTDHHIYNVRYTHDSMSHQLPVSLGPMDQGYAFRPQHHLPYQQDGHHQHAPTTADEALNRSSKFTMRLTNSSANWRGSSRLPAVNQQQPTALSLSAPHPPSNSVQSLTEALTPGMNNDAAPLRYVRM